MNKKMDIHFEDVGRRKESIIMEIEKFDKKFNYQNLTFTFNIHMKNTENLRAVSPNTMV